MKTSIRSLSVVALCAAFATTTAEAGMRLIPQGRAGYTLVPAPKTQSSAKSGRPETTVALVIGKPDRPTTQLQTMGRSGYRIVPARSQNR